VNEQDCGWRRSKAVLHVAANAFTEKAAPKKDGTNGLLFVPGGQ